MAVSTTNAVSGPYVANGVTTSFPITFKLLDAGGARVTITVDDVETEIAPTEFATVINEGGNGGSAVFGTAPAAGDLRIYSEPAFIQEAAFSSGQRFSPTAVNDALDRAAIRDQYLLRKVDAAIDAIDAGIFGDVRSELASPAPGKGVDLVAGAGRVVRPQDYGAIDVSFADNRTAIANAITASAALGLPVDGGDTQYSIFGNVAVTEQFGPWIRSLRLKQTNAATAGAVLYFDTCQQIRIDGLNIDCGANNTVGDMNSTFGLHVEGGSGHNIANVNVTGNGKRSYVAIWFTTKSVYPNINVHDCAYDDAAATDDALQGIWFYGNTDCLMPNPRVNDLTGNALPPFNSIYTRGIVFNANVRCSILGPQVSNVDQGADFTGSDGNLNCSIIGGIFYQCAQVGVKLANSAVGCKVIGVIVDRAGTYGFGCSGPSESGLTHKTMDCEFIGCTAIDIGWNNFPTYHRGFSILSGGFDTNYANGIRIIDCKAIDRQAVKTMEIGFYNEIAFDPALKKPNLLLGDCTSEGHTVAAEQGFHRYECHLTGTGTVALANGAATAIGWDAEADDTMLMHSTSVNSDTATIMFPGVYKIEGKLLYAASGTGYRRIQIQKNGSPLITNAFAPPTGEACTCLLSEEVTLAAGDTLKLFGEQNSGGSLNVQRPDSYLRIKRVRPL